MAHVIKDIRECERLWRKWSRSVPAGENSAKSLFDRWEARIALYDPEYAKPHFIVDEQGKWLLPLWHSKEEELYEFFGGSLAEDNRIFMQQSSKELLISMLEALPEWCYLFYIHRSQQHFGLLQEMHEHPKFILDTSKTATFEEYLERFSGKHRKNFLNDLKRVSAEVKVRENAMEDIDFLMAMNKKRFGDNSDFHSPLYEKGFRNLLEWARKDRHLHLYSLEKEGKIVASEAAVFADGTYTVINGGFDTAVKNAGKLLIALHIQKAIQLKAGIVDFLTHDSGWKKLWKLEEVMQWEYVKEAKQ